MNTTILQDRKRLLLLVLLGTVLVLLIVRGVRHFSNPYPGVLRDETRSITLTPSNDPRQVIYENENVRISIGYDQYLELNSPNSKEELSSEPGAQSPLFLDDEDEYLVADALEAGKAAVFDKHRQVQVKSINIRYYETLCGPMCGGGARFFYLQDANILRWNGTQILEVWDWNY